jgi:RNA polymerase sigma factor for flagellar operon FliA
MPSKPSRMHLTLEQQQTVVQNLPLVEHIVTRMTARFPANYSRDDLVQTGTIGLIEAATRFDPEHGVAFSTFAGRRIEGSIIDMLRRNDWAPRSVRALERRVEAAEQSLTFAHRGMPDRRSVSDAAGVAEGDLARLRADLSQASLDSLDRPTAQTDGVSTLGDNLADFLSLGSDEELDAKEMRGFFRDAIELLPDRHQMVIIGYFFEGRSMTELGEYMGVTQSRASQVKEEAIRMIRHAIEAQYNDDPAEPTSIKGRRQQAFSDAVGEASDWRSRLADSLEVSAIA